MRVLVSVARGYVGAVSSTPRAAARTSSSSTTCRACTGRPCLAGVPPRNGELRRRGRGRRDSGAGPDRCILHCAARLPRRRIGRDPSLYYRSNVVGGIALPRPPARPASAGSSSARQRAVYGIPDSTPIDEDPRFADQHLRRSKRTFEAAMAATAPRTACAPLTPHFNVAGATEWLGEDHDPETHLIPNIFGSRGRGRAVDAGLARLLHTVRNLIRDYIHVADLAAHNLGAGGDRPRRRSTADAALCNLGNGGGFSVRQVLEAAERSSAADPAHGRPAPRRRPADPRGVGSPAESVLVWRPQRPTLEE